MKVKNDFTLGILGGMGPMAGVEFQKRIIKKMPAKGDSDHIKMVCFTNPKIKDRSSCLKNGEDFSNEISKSFNLMVNFGVNLGVMICNTAHANFEKIKNQTKFPLVNIIEETVEFLANKFYFVGRVGLLATDGTIQSGLYESLLTKKGIITILPTLEDQQGIMNIIYGRSGIKAGCLNSNKIKLRRIIQDLEDDGADLIILGCTELSLLGIEGEKIIDPLDVVAEVIVKKRLN